MGSDIAVRDEPVHQHRLIMPRAMLAMPPITIQGTPAARRELVISASACSRYSASAGLLLRTLLNPRPTTADLLHAALGDLVARPGPQAHLREGAQRGEGPASELTLAVPPASSCHPSDRFLVAPAICARGDMGTSAVTLADADPLA